jgi:hypothetical protein
MEKLEKFGSYKILIGKPGGKKSLGRRRSRWEELLRWILGKHGLRA